MNEILAVGSVALDTIENDRGRVENIPGGSLSYFLSAAALYKKVIPVGVVGFDFPTLTEAWGEGRKIDTSNFLTENGRTFRWGGKYSEDLDFRQTLFTELGVFGDFKPKLSGAAKKAKYVFLGNISPELQLSVIDQADDRSFKALDTMNYWIDGFYETLIEAISKIDLLFINDQELLHLAGKNSETGSLLELFGLGLKYLVLKKGKNGAFIFSKNKYGYSGIYKASIAIDTTGAGDSFAGGFMGHLASTTNSTDVNTAAGWKNLKSSLARGAAAASFAIEDFGLTRLIGAGKRDLEKRARDIQA